MHAIEEKRRPVNSQRPKKRSLERWELTVKSLRETLVTPLLRLETTSRREQRCGQDVFLSSSSPSIITSLIGFLTMAKIRYKMQGLSLFLSSYLKKINKEKEKAAEKREETCTSFQPDRIPSTIGSLSCLAVTFTTQQINS